MQPEIVLLGGPNSGKTHFAGQLYGRVKQRRGQLKLQKSCTPKNLAAFENVLASLEAGHAAGHTAHDSWEEVCLPLENSTGQQFNLHWPDYGGEQLKAVYRDRKVTPEWAQRLQTATAWMLLIRLDSEITYPNALAQLGKPSAIIEEKIQTPARASNWDANAYWVELLQILLHVAGHGTVNRLQQPKLAIMLSCYDLLSTDSLRPEQVLAAKLPLLYSFIRNNWALAAAQVWGLSSLGKTLEETSEDEEFIQNGPEKQGWVICPTGGERDADLTKPVNSLTIA